MNESEDIDLDEDVEGGPDDASGLDEDSIDGEFADDESSDSSDGFEEDADKADDDGDEDEESRPRARKVDDDADDDDEEEEDVEADLDQILRGRMATDDDDDEDEVDAVADEGAKPGAVNARKSDEFVCGICFMVVAQKQTELPCPMGDGLEPHQPLDM